ISAAAEVAGTARALRRRWATSAWTNVLVAEIDAPFGEIVGRHLDGDFIAGEDADAVLLHASGRVGYNLMSVVELDAAACIGEHLHHHALKLEHLFLRHQGPCWATQRAHWPPGIDA